MKSIRRTITIILITFLCIMGIQIKSQAVTDIDFASWARDDLNRWFGSEPLQYLGAWIHEQGSQYMTSSYCAQKNHNGLVGGNKYISNIYDIDIGTSSRPGTVVSRFPGGTITSNSASTWGARNMTELAYIAANTARRDIYTSNYNNKLTLQYRLFEISSQVRSDLGMSGYIEGPDGVYNIGQLIRYCQNFSANASSYAATTASYQFADKSTKDVQTIEVIDGKSYIGPYKVEHSGGTFTQGKVWTQSGVEYTTTQIAYTPGGATTSIQNIGSWSDFYFVFNGEVDSAEKVRIYKTFPSWRARIMILSGQGTSQSIMIYGGGPASQVYELGLPKVPFSYIKITKTEEHSGNPIPNVGFIVSWKETQDSETIKWVKDGTPAKLVDSREEATVYKTDANGLANVRNLNKKGYYTVYEVVNPNFGFEDTSYDDPCIVVESNIKAVGQLIRLNLTNERRYIKLSGYVWEDMISEKQSVRNWLYNRDDNDDFDKLIANMTVSLRDKNGNLLQAYNDDGEQVGTIQPRKTNSEGYYEFGNYWAEGYETEKIRIDDIVDGAYIEFEYNGMSYKSVPLFHTLGLDNSLESKGSRATDDTNRSRSGENNQYFYSTRYATVTSNEATDTEGRVTSLEYDFANNRSTLKYADNTSSYIYGYDGQSFPIDGIYDKYKTFANTKDANNGIMGKGLTENDIYKNNMEEIPYINLGLYEREMPDLSVMQDIDSAQLRLNGYTHTYLYDQRFADDGVYKEDGFNVAVKFGEKYSSNSYTRKIYSSDLTYNEMNPGTLEVYITYKIAIRNEATTVTTRINELANYYDSRFDIVAIGDGINSNTHEIEGVGNVKNTEVAGESGYKKSILYAGQGKVIEPLQETYVYIQYKLNNEAVNAVLNGNVTLSSITEVNSYSSFEKGSSTVYSGVDRDSRPDSITPDVRETYEDDTDSAPTLILETEAARMIQGTIWEDKEIQEILNGEGYNKRREGDGIYNNEENVVKDVKVELLKVSDKENTLDYEIANLYQRDTENKGQEVPATYTTGNDGKYIFDGVIPGQYLIRYTYGDASVICDTQGNVVENVEAEKYKSTKYRNYQNEDEYLADDNLYWYRAETSRDDNNETTNNVSRLSDARDIRGLYGDEYVDVVERRTSIDNINYGYATYEDTLTEIQSETKVFDIKLDYDVNLDNISKYGIDLKFDFDNIDFGIIRRPVQEIKIIKEISYIEITLANGQTIISGDPRTDDIEHLKMLPQSGNPQQGGTVYVEIDNEIIQGATLKLTYEITVNLDGCEVDYNNKDYYYYNTVPENNEGWKIATIQNLYDYVADDLNFDEDNQVFRDKNGVEIDYKWNSVDIGDLVVGENVSEEVYNEIKDFTKILQTDYFADMNPENRDKTARLQLTRVLSNNELDFTFDNDIEINEAGGRIPDDSIPGNYKPSESPNEPDESEVELIITGPTGENQQYLPYIILIISGTIILVTGIIFIKKKVINSDD